MTRRLRISDLTDFAVPEQPALAPDGGHVVHVLRTQDTDTHGAGRSQWSPDGGKIAFAAVAERLVLDLTTSGVRQRTGRTALLAGRS